MIAIKLHWFVLAIALVPDIATACEQASSLKGMLSIPQCDPASAVGGCIPGSRAAFDALEALEMTEVFTIGLRSTAKKRVGDLARRRRSAGVR